MQPAKEDSTRERTVALSITRSCSRRCSTTNEQRAAGRRDAVWAKLGDGKRLCFPLSSATCASVSLNYF